MSRIKNFTDTKSKEYQDVDTILENDGETCNVYEAVNVEGAGFSQEVGTLQLVERILVKISRKKEVLKPSSNGQTLNRMVFVALCSYPRAKIGQIWNVADKNFRVTKVDTASSFKIEVQLERVE